MSDHGISIIPRQSGYPNNKIKAKEILDWLVSKDIVKPDASDCILSSEHGFAISEGAKYVTPRPETLPFGLMVNGLEIITERQVFHTGGNGIEELICPNCHKNLSEEDWTFFAQWQDQESNDIACPLCNTAADIHEFIFKPEWGFSNLGFTFWNWGELSDGFIAEFREKLDCEITLVYQRI